MWPRIAVRFGIPLLSFKDVAEDRGQVLCPCQSGEATPLASASTKLERLRGRRNREASCLTPMPNEKARRRSRLLVEQVEELALVHHSPTSCAGLDCLAPSGGPGSRSVGAPTKLRPNDDLSRASRLPPIADLSTCDLIARKTSRETVRSPASASSATASARSGGTRAAIVTRCSGFTALTSPML